MRKRYKVKRRACGLCKPWKRGWMKRLNPRELFKQKIYEQETKRIEVPQV